jgi:hypothetical protein
MKTSIYIALIITTLLFTTSCTKFGRTDTVKDRIMNPITGKGFVNARVALLKEEAKLFGGLKAVKEVFTDEDGNF